MTSRTFRQQFTTWFRASRPWSYTASTIPVVLGSITAAYDGAFHAGLFLLVLLGSNLILGGTNFANDYFDHIKGADRPDSLSMGGALVRGDLQPRQVFIASLLCFGAGSLIGLYLVSVAGPFILWIGIFSVLAGFFYTAGPFALAYVGLGEIAVFIFMGPIIVVGSYYVQAQVITVPAVLHSLPIGFLVAAILHANNLRDLDDDRELGKRTMATVLGHRGARIEYYVLLTGTYVTQVIIVLVDVAPWTTLLCLLSLPAALERMRLVATERTPAGLHPLLKKTSQLHMQFGVLVVGGWVLALLLPGLV